jgi:oligopeptide/dipeptide ABC transporter ATP-binding protein
MRQRVMIAISLIADPCLIIADEPTSALDVTVQHRVLSLLSDICESRGTAIILITHDLGVVAQLCDRVLVLYGGIVVEESDVVSLFAQPRHPYTQALLRILPRLGKRGEPVPIPGSITPVVGELDHCPFHLRCDRAVAACHNELPVHTGNAAGRVRCHLAAEERGQPGGPAR